MIVYRKRSPLSLILRVPILYIIPIHIFPDIIECFNQVTCSHACGGSKPNVVNDFAPRATTPPTRNLHLKIDIIEEVYGEIFHWIEWGIYNGNLFFCSRMEKGVFKWKIPNLSDVW